MSVSQSAGARQIWFHVCGFQFRLFLFLDQPPIFKKENALRLDCFLSFFCTHTRAHKDTHILASLREGVEFPASPPQPSSPLQWTGGTARVRGKIHASVCICVYVLCNFYEPSRLNSSFPRKKNFLLTKPLGSPPTKLVRLQ